MLLYIIIEQCINTTVKNLYIDSYPLKLHCYLLVTIECNVTMPFFTTKPPKKGDRVPKVALYLSYLF